MRTFLLWLHRARAVRSPGDRSARGRTGGLDQHCSRSGSWVSRSTVVLGLDLGILLLLARVLGLLASARPSAHWTRRLTCAPRAPRPRFSSATRTSSPSSAASSPRTAARSRSRRSPRSRILGAAAGPADEAALPGIEVGRGTLVAGLPAANAGREIEAPADGAEHPQAHPGEEGVGGGASGVSSRSSRALISPQSPGSGVCGGAARRTQRSARPAASIRPRSATRWRRGGRWRSRRAWRRRRRGALPPRSGAGAWARGRGSASGSASRSGRRRRGCPSLR